MKGSDAWKEPVVGGRKKEKKRSGKLGLFSAGTGVETFFRKTKEANRGQKKEKKLPWAGSWK